MIIDYILDRYENSKYELPYSVQEFRDSIAQYYDVGISDGDKIVDAIDKGNEQEVRATLITYLIDNKYNPRIMDYVLSVDWLKDIPNEQPSVVDLDAKPANEQEYQKQIEHYKQIVNELTGENTYVINSQQNKDNDYKNLSPSDIETLKKWGHSKEDLSQIDYAITHTDFYLCNNEICIEEPITPSKAREILGDETFLSGISRSAFHWTAAREYDCQQTVFFDSSKMFKGYGSDGGSERELEYDNEYELD